MQLRRKNISSFLCPISMSTMKDPMLLQDQYCFDFQSIKKWLIKNHKTNPLTGLEIYCFCLVPNRQLKQEISQLTDKVQQHLLKNNEASQKYLCNIFHISDKAFLQSLKGKNNCKLELYDENSYYYGQFEDNKREGQGIQVWDNKVIYEGEWKNDKYDGKGILKLKKHIYKGNFVKGYFEGKGTLRNLQSCIYEGQWRNGKKQGQGKQFYNKLLTNFYEGNFKNNKKNGVGKIVKNKSQQLKGKWVNDELVHGIKYNEDFIYEGQFENMKFNGKGKITFLKERGKYIRGSFRDNMIYGYGQECNFDGQILYAGYWKNNHKYGFGTSYQNGKIAQSIGKCDESSALVNENQQYNNFDDRNSYSSVHTSSEEDSEQDYQNDSFDREEFGRKRHQVQRLSFSQQKELFIENN